MHAQLEAAGTQAGVAKLSLLCFGQQAVMDSYLCLVLLTTGLVVDELFPAFSGAAFLQARTAAPTVRYSDRPVLRLFE